MAGLVRAWSNTGNRYRWFVQIPSHRHASPPERCSLRGDIATGRGKRQCCLLCCHCSCRIIVGWWMWRERLHLRAHPAASPLSDFYLHLRLNRRKPCRRLPLVIESDWRERSVGGAWEKIGTIRDRAAAWGRRYLHRRRHGNADDVMLFWYFSFFFRL